MALLDKCAIALDAAMMNHPFFGIASQARLENIVIWCENSIVLR
jgi:hypothetical protein